MNNYEINFPGISCLYAEYYHHYTYLTERRDVPKRFNEIEYLR